MKELILVLLKKDQEALGDVRCFPGLRIAEHEGLLWIRGIPVSGNPDLKIRQLPAFTTYFLDNENRLFPVHSLTPTGKLPEKTWIPLQEFLPVALPLAALPGELKEKKAVRLIPSDKIEKGNALVITLAQWKAYAEKAPGIRLEKTRFAVSEDDRVIVISDPLIPVPGKEYHLRATLLLPCGYDFDPPVISGLLSNKLNPAQDCLLLFSVEGHWEKIPLKNFVQGKRSAVRLTEGGPGL